MWELKDEPISRRRRKKPVGPLGISPIQAPKQPKEPKQPSTKPPHPYEAPEGRYWRWNERKAAVNTSAQDKVGLALYYLDVAESMGLDPVRWLQNVKVLRDFRKDA